MLQPGFYDVPRGMIAAIVTHLNMTTLPDPHPVRPVAGAEITHCVAPDIDWYRDIYRRVGGTDWLWFSRLALSDEALSLILGDPAVSVHVLKVDGVESGFFELDFRTEGRCELAFFGLVPNAIGTGVGRLMMTAALREAWARPIDEVWVHTCTLDHPGAIEFYRRSGFVVTGREVEIAADPRLSGVLPRSAAPHVPIVE
ncbi:GNAT family N-acetyltransferase [Rhodobacteraceae bacterium SC52]|nr:GNAT family N-acetyltransferase [Rhodobacteraceae bacterium SC52]